MTIGEALRKIRTEKGISAKDLSIKLGLHKSYIAKVENGSIIPTHDKLVQIYEKMGIPKELSTLLLLNKDNFSDDKKAMFEGIKSSLLDLATDYALNKSSQTNKQVNSVPDFALIMKGGGIKGIAYIGALEILKDHYKFNWYVGTSAGAITAALLASGYTNEELQRILVNKKFSDFKDAKFLIKLHNLIIHKGLYQAEAFRNWISTLLAEKLNSPVDVTMANLPNRLTIYASRRNQKALIFDSKEEKSKHISVSFATRCSMSIPFFFTPQKEQGLNVYDGGVQNNYPVSILMEDNPETDFIGLYLGSPIFEREKLKSGIFADLFSIWSETNDIESLSEYASKTIIIDPRPISTLDFKLTEPEKNYLLEIGRLAALNFLRKNKKIEMSNKQFEDKKIEVDKLKQEITKTRKWKRRIKRIIIPSFIILLIAIYSFI